MKKNVISYSHFRHLFISYFITDNQMVAVLKRGVFDDTRPLLYKLYELYELSTNKNGRFFGCVGVGMFPYKGEEWGVFFVQDK